MVYMLSSGSYLIHRPWERESMPAITNSLKSIEKEVFWNNLEGNMTGRGYHVRINDQCLQNVQLILKKLMADNGQAREKSIISCV